MKSSLAIFAAAFGISAILTPLVRLVALKIGAFDEPTKRHVHTKRIPRLGGIAVVVAFLGSLLVLFAIEQSSLGRLLLHKPVLVGGLFIGGLGAAALGALDDLRGMRALHKLGVQVALASIAYACGFQIEGISLPWVGVIHFGLLGVPVTVLWFVAVMNAVNLIDGLDGLAGGIAFFACVSNFVVGWLNDALLVVFLSAALAGAVLGFLVYNFNPASIFLGDTGSLFLGFVLAATSLLGNSIKSSTTVALLVPILALGVPIMDTLFAMVRRWLERRPIFAPDRGHIHHRLLDLGLTHRRAVLTLYGMSFVLAGSAIAVAAGRNWEVGGALLVVAMVVVGFVRASRIFASVKLRREASPAKSDFVENLVDRVLRVIDDLRGAETESEAQQVFEGFVRAAKITHAVMTLPKGVRWEVGGPNGARGKVKLGLHSKRNIQIHASFEFVDEWAKSRIHAEVLLQLVLEAVARRYPAPAPKAVPERERRESGEAAIVTP